MAWCRRSGLAQALLRGAAGRLNSSLKVRRATDMFLFIFHLYINEHVLAQAPYLHRYMLRHVM